MVTVLMGFHCTDIIKINYWKQIIIAAMFTFNSLTFQTYPQVVLSGVYDLRGRLKFRL